jgi:PBS lyase HEAT-like repeat
LIEALHRKHYLSREIAARIRKEGRAAMRVILGFCCSLLVMVTAATTSRASKAPAQVDVHFRFQEGVAALHEPVVLLFEVHNGLKQPITVTVGSLSRQFYDLTMTTPRGQILRKDPFSGQVNIVTLGDGKIIVEPGADYKEPLVMNQWFPFESQGTYSLTSKLTSDIETADLSFQAESQTAQLLINARDPARLNKICADLEQQAEMASTVEAAQFPALELSYANDPIAVSYLDRLLSAHTLAYEKAVQGLERIGTDEAVEVLLSALNENWGDIAELATRSLGRMQDQITNPSLKETVKKAVDRSSARARN